MLEKLTEEQEALMQVVVDEWMEMIHSSADNMDPEVVKEKVNWLYEWCNLKKPEEIIIVDSPMAIQREINKICGNETMQYYPFVFRTNIEAWPALYEYFRRIGIVDLKAFEDYMEYIKSGIGWAVYFEKVAIVCPIFSEMHQIEVETEQGKEYPMHSLEGPAISWGDGYALHFVEGVYFDPDLHQRAVVDRNLSGQEILQLKNTEQKAVLIKLYGMECILDDVDAKTLDTYTTTSAITGQEVNYSLIEFDIDDITVRSVVVECHTEHKRTALGVPISDETDTCMGAIAWTFGMDIDEYQPMMES